MPSNIVMINHSKNLEWHIGDSKIEKVIALLNELGIKEGDGKQKIKKAKIFKWLCWESIKYGTAHTWLDSPILYSTISVENHAYLRNWKRPFWIYAKKCGSTFYITFTFGWLHRHIHLDFMRGVSSSDILKRKEEIRAELAKQK